jgi:RNA polymerase sigma factor (sigma-70 family)
MRGLFEHGVTSALTDGQLLERFASRSGESSELAFAALVDRHGTMVFRACHAILGDEHEAMDSFQATFLLLAQNARSLWVRDSLAPWLHRVACRAAARARSLAARRKRLAREAAELGVTQSRAAGQQALDLASDLHEEINRLPERYRDAVVLCELKGYTVDEAARLVKCPVGTLASRLARGRQKLRDRLTRRGANPALAAPAILRTAAPAAFQLPSSLAESTVSLVIDFTAGRAAQSVLSSTAVALARSTSRSLFMAKLRFSAVIIAALGGVSVLATWAGQSLARPQSAEEAPPIERKLQAQERDARKPAAHNEAKADPAKKPPDELELLGDKTRYENFLHASVGNMRPLIQDKRGARFQSRLLVTYNDGSAKLWSMEKKEPIVPPLRHPDPIREAAFIEQAKLVITSSKLSVKIWDALSGELRKEIEGEVMRPLLFTDISTCAEPGPDPIRFATVDVKGSFVTIWDAATLKPFGVIRPEGAAKLIGAGMTRNGKTLATIAEDRSVTLWAVADSKAFATLGLPSPLVAQCFVDDKLSTTGPLRLDGRFWEKVGPILPGASEKK